MSSAIAAASMIRSRYPAILDVGLGPTRIEGPAQAIGGPLGISGLAGITTPGAAIRAAAKQLRLKRHALAPPDLPPQMLIGASLELSGCRNPLVEEMFVN